MRRSVGKLWLAGTLCGLVLALLPVGASAQQLYTTTDLGKAAEPCPPGDGSLGINGTAINRKGDVVGSLWCNGSSAPTPQQGFLYHHRTGRIEIIGPNGTSLAGVNDAGIVTGSVVNAQGDDEYAFIFSHKQMTNITPGEQGGASGINDRGTVVGGITPSGTQDSQAFEWNNGILTNLNSLFGGGGPVAANTGAGAINDRGDIVGVCWTSGHACGCSYTYTNTVAYYLLRTTGAVVPLSTPDGVGCGYYGPYLRAINRYDEVVGSNGRDQGSRAVVWVHGQLLSLDTGEGASFATGINDAGEIVGEIENPPSSYTAVVWNGQVSADLNTLIAPTDPLYGLVQLYRADAVNDAGQILVEATYTAGGETTLILDPVPPSAQVAAR